MTEKFKKIKGFERYTITSCGRVLGVNGQELKQRKASNGYWRVNLRKGNIIYEKPTVVSVHRLVAENFIPNPNKYNSVNHIDGNKNNNCVSNLEWVTPQENTLHSYAHGLQTIKIGKDNKRSKSVIQFNARGTCIEKYSGMREAERKTGINNASISACCNKKQKSAGGFIWRYASVGVVNP